MCVCVCVCVCVCQFCLNCHYLQDEQYSHIDAEEMKKVEDDVKKRRQWMDEKSQAQALLPKHADPVVKVSQIQTEQQVREYLLALCGLAGMVCLF